ncbi:lipoprotein [Escherichia coli]|nr:lipoprotein [Escherichia coli]
MANDSWSGQDKAQHFIASAMLSAAGNEYSQHQGDEPGSQCHVWIDVLCQFGGVKRALG